MKTFIIDGKKVKYLNDEINDEKKINPIPITKKKLKLSIYTSLRIVLTGVIGGLAIAIALILQTPIMNWVAQLNIEDPNINLLLTILYIFALQ